MRPNTRDAAVLTAALCLLGLLAGVSVCVGSFPLSLSQIVALLQGKYSDSLEAQVFWSLRLPRVAAGLLAGLGLGLAGGVYQSIFRNPLASPDLTGVSSGASFGAACAIVSGTGSALSIMAGAFCGGLLSLLLVLLLVRAARMERTGTYVLAGIIISSGAQAGLMCLKLMADPERELASIEFWTMGSLASLTAGKLALLLLFRRPVTILSLGEETARSVGLSTRFWRALLLGLTTLMVAALAAVAGVIAFVGLIAPHIAFLLLRRRGGSSLTLCALVGGCLVLGADILARSLSPGAELPLSIFTILFSIPLLALLLCGKLGGRYGRAP